MEFMRLAISLLLFGGMQSTYQSADDPFFQDVMQTTQSISIKSVLNGRYLQWVEGEESTLCDCKAKLNSSPNQRWTMFWSVSPSEAYYRFLNAGKSQKGFLRFDEGKAGNVDVDGVGRDWNFVRIEPVHDDIVRLYGMHCGQYLSIAKDGQVTRTSDPESEHTEFRLVKADDRDRSVLDKVWTHSVMSQGGGMQITQWSEDWSVDRVMVNDKAIAMDASRCVLDRSGDQLFCAFSTSAIMEKVDSGSILNVMMRSKDGEKREHPIRVLVKQSLFDITLHLLFDKTNKIIRIFLLPQSSEAVQWRGRPMGIVNAGNTCYMNALVQSMVAALHSEITKATHARFAGAADMPSMMMLEVLRTYLNLAYAGVINPDTFQYYILILADFCGNARGSMEDTMEQFIGGKLGGIKIISEWMVETKLQPGLLSLSAGSDVVPAPPVTAWGIPRNQQEGILDTDTDVSSAQLYNWQTAEQTKYDTLVAKVKHDTLGLHYWACTAWAAQWFTCNDESVSVAERVGSFEGNDVGLFYRRTNTNAVLPIAVSNAQHLVSAIGALMAGTAANRIHARKITAEAAVVAGLMGVVAANEQNDGAKKRRVSDASPLPLSEEDFFDVDEYGGVAIKVPRRNKCVACLPGNGEEIGLILVDCSGHKTSTKSAIWFIKLMDNGMFRLENMETGKCLRFKDPQSYDECARVDGAGGIASWTWLYRIPSSDGKTCSLKSHEWGTFLATSGDVVVAQYSHGQETGFELIGTFGKYWVS